MKIPKLNTKYKIRDMAICKSYVADNETMATIAESFSLSLSRIKQILYKNREYLMVDRNWEKVKRIHWYRKQAKNQGNTKKDSADIYELIRKEIEGDSKTEINVGVGVTVMPSVELKDGSRARFNVGD